MVYSVVGKGALQHSMAKKVIQEDAWRLYARRQNTCLRGRADEHDCPNTLFKAAVTVVDEDS